MARTPREQKNYYVRVMTPSYWTLKFNAMLLRTNFTIADLTRWHVQGLPGDWRIAYPKVSSVYTIPSTHSKRKITIREWSPPSSSEKLRPIHLSYHSSGYVLPNLGQDSDFCQRLAAKFNITVLDCDYAKGPENPFPAAYDDVADTVAHILASGDKYDLSNFTIGGFSIGGTIALQVPTTLDIAKGKIKASLAMYPACDLAHIAPAPVAGPPGSTGVLLTPDVLELFWDSYLWAGADPTDPRISPTYCDISLLPNKLCIVTAGLDSLRFEADRLVEKIKATNSKDIVSKEIADVGHLWDKTAAPGTWEAERKEEMYNFVFDWFKTVYAS